MDQMTQQHAVQKFQEYLRIKTVHPKPDYAAAVKFLDNYAKDLGLECKHVEVGGDRTVIVVMTLKGKNPALPSVLLNTHTDVVPAVEELWKYSPWSGHKDEQGNIYGRGAQDMKCVGIQYLEAMRQLIATKKPPFERTIHITFMPDEEINDGHLGMKLFIGTPEFLSMNVGFSLDEGLANPTNKYSVFYGQRSTWNFRIICRGNTGHGSQFIANTAINKLRKVLESFSEFRDEQEARLNQDRSISLGDVTTINLTKLEGGIASNVVAPELIATFDLRVPPHVDSAKLEQTIFGWCKSAGDNVTCEFTSQQKDPNVTNLEANSVWWSAFTAALKQIGCEFDTTIFPAGTDGAFLRDEGYPVIGFSPMRNTPVLLHDNDEFLNEKIFLEGINVYCSVISALANVGPTTLA